MKRKHIYLGGTVLLILLGALGGFFLFTGDDEEAARSKSGEAEQSADAAEVVPIEVPPIEDEAFNVPSMPATDPPSERYARGGSPYGGDQEHRPEAGGASALPAVPPPTGDAMTIDAPSDDDKTMDGSPTYDAVSPGYGASEPESQQETDIVTRGQEPHTVEATSSDPANALRLDARAAFGADSEETEMEQGQPADAAEGRYTSPAELETDALYVGDSTGAPVTPADPPADDSPAETSEFDYRQDFSSTDDTPYAPQGPSAPAPIDIAAQQGASPLQEASAPAGFPQESAQDAHAAQPGAPAYVEDEGNSYEGGREQPIAASPGAYGSGVSGADIDAVPTQAPGAMYGAAAVSESDEMRGLSGPGSAGTGRPGEPALEGLQMPQISIEKAAPTEIQVGKNCKFQIVVRNVGPVPARDVRLVDEVPLGTQFVEAIPRPTTVGSRLEWELGSLAPGDEASVEVTLLPTEEGEIGSVATVQFAAAASARTRCTRPELEVRAEVAPMVMIGQQQVVRITLRNPGSGDATGVMLFESVPQGMSHPHGRALEFEVGTLHAGESRELELVLNAEEKGIVQNKIVARGDASLTAEYVAEFEVVAPEIAISVAGPARKYLELPATFTVAIENPGTAAAKDVELVGKLPEGLEFVSADNYGQYDAATRSVYWSLAELPPKGRGEVKLVTLPVDLGEQRLQVQAGADLGLADQAESALQVEGLAAIKFEVSDIADPVEVGSETSYEIRVVNQGSKAATNVQVVAQFPEGIQPVRAEGPRSVTDDVQVGQVVFSPLKQLSPKADTTYRIVAKGLQPGDQRVLVKVMTDDLEQPINEEESTRVYADR